VGDSCACARLLSSAAFCVARCRRSASDLKLELDVLCAGASFGLSEREQAPPEKAQASKRNMRIVFINKSANCGPRPVAPSSLNRRGAVDNNKKEGRSTEVWAQCVNHIVSQRNFAVTNVTNAGSSSGRARSNREPRCDDGDARPNDQGPSTSARPDSNTMAHACNRGDRQLRSRCQWPVSRSEQARPHTETRPTEQQVCDS